MMKKIVALMLTLVLVVGLAACGGKDSSKSGGSAVDGFVMSVNFASEPESIDPALNRAVDGGVMLNHTFEGLMKWENDGQGHAVVVAGQAEKYDAGEVKEDGSRTYTFHLRDDIKWSDGEAVTAQDFEYALKRLVDPVTTSPYNYMADFIVNATEIMGKKKDPSELGVRAIDEKTLEIDVAQDVPYLEELLAFPALYPVRQDVIEEHGDQWTFSPETYISNGPMVMKEWNHNANILLVPNENYYARENVTLDGLDFKLMDDENAMLQGFRNGDLDYIQNVPVDEIQTLLDSGELHVVDYVGTYYACFNNSRAPFDNPKVREALSLVIDRNYIVEEVTRTGEHPANAFVPSGIADKDGASGDDFRTVGGEYYSVAKEDYEANCEKARELLAEAGYPNGENFPIVEYLYNTDEKHKVIGEALQNMWQEELGITVTLNNQDWAVFLQTRTNGDYDISRNGWIADYNDPISFLDIWVTDGGNNDAHYGVAEYDELITKAKTSSDPAERMQAMHDAEDIFMGRDSATAPLYFYTQKYMLTENIEGMYYTPLGFFFFEGCTQKAA